MTSPDLVEQNLRMPSTLPTAGVKELFKLSLPLIFVLLSGALMSFCDRLFLAHFSLEAFEGCVNGAYLCMLFQLPCIRISSMAQIFVGFHKGANNQHLIGECVWQMIWFSLLSMIITLPVGMVSAPLFFGGTSIEAPATTYFHTLMSANFLFPLGAALSSFYIAEERIKVLFCATLVSHLLNVGLDYLLIFGVNGFIPPLGIFGASLATAIAQGSFCAILFVLFLKERYQTLYNTHNWALKWRSFWSYVRVGIPRAIARMIVLVAWAATARIMTLKGGDYLLVLSVGGTLFLLFSFINEGMGQAIMNIASRLIGAKEYAMLRKLRLSSFLMLATTMSVLTLPFFFFPDALLDFFFSTRPDPETLAMLRHSCIWLWTALLCNGINMIGFGLISAALDTVFHMITNCFVWLTSYLPVYLAYQIGTCPPEFFWLFISFDGLALSLVFHWRASKNNLKPTCFDKCHLNLL